MSQDYYKKGKARSRRPLNDDDDDAHDRDAADSASSSTRPAHASSSSSRLGFMTVGSGAGSEHTSRLQQMLMDNDSGYAGSSMAGDDIASLGPMPAWDQSMNTDSVQSGAVYQLWFNQYRLSLARSIGSTIELLRGLQETNSSWPAHYPSVQRAEGVNDLGRSSARPMLHSFSTADDRPDSSSSISPLPALRRAMTTMEDEGESSRAAGRRNSATEPRLVTSQIANEFSILKLDLKLGALHHAEVVHSLERGSIASLLDGKIRSSIRHLLSLRERIEDTSSKVLVTGDLNAGKSTFCNALLRRKILPEDQQPCTAIFCEVLDARKNRSFEEVHAVHKDAVYEQGNESTYDTFDLDELEKVVTDSDTYAQCKVYVRDVRRVDESLLNNGVIEIALIDAPGLNSDTTKTTAIFARQEEIDVVVFVVSAANHFTQTAKEFIGEAAAEKAYFFIVVNGFDNIRDKNRCQSQIHKKIREHIPRTAKESSELVHFVSSNAIPVAPPPSAGSSGPGPGDGNGDPGDDDPKGKGKDVEKIRDFERLEQSLRRFILEKRAQSKLAPAKTYLANILNDLNVLATVNVEVARSELERVTQELLSLEPQLESSRRARADVSEQLEGTIEQTTREIYDHTRAAISAAIGELAASASAVPYPGLLSAFAYADALQVTMLSHVADAVAQAEEHARDETAHGVNMIKELGVKHLGNEYENLTFRSDVMFRRRRDALARQVEVSADVTDFFDWSAIMQQQEKVAGTGMALTIATAVGTRMLGGYGWMNHALSAVKLLGNDNVKKLIVPGLICATIGAGAYVLMQIPQSLPKRLSAKVSKQLATLDHVHSNSSRISNSAGKVLRIPADHLRVGLEQSVRELGQKRDETVKVKSDSEGALRYFRDLVRDSIRVKGSVQEVDLDTLGHHGDGA